MMLAIDGKKFMAIWSMLKYSYGFIPIIIGLDKFFYYIVDWNIYVSPAVIMYIPLSLGALVKVVGIIEIIAGLIVLSPFELPINGTYYSATRLGAYLVAVWLIVIVLNLFTMGQ